MRIAIISHQVGAGDGQGRVTYEIAQAALNAAIEVTLITERCALEFSTHESVRSVIIPTSRLPTRFMKNLSFAVRSALWLKRNVKSLDLIQANGFITMAPVDIVVAHFVHGAWLHSPYASRGGTRWTISGLYQRIYSRLNALLEQTAFRRARRIVAVSENVATELISVGVRADKIEIIFNGVDTGEFHPRRTDRSTTGAPAGAVIFLFCGDLRTHRKNLDGVLRAVATVEGIHLAVAGCIDGSPYPALAKELGVFDRVHFLGYVRDMSSLMASTDAFIFPSRYDPLGLVVFEAMSSGLPVITASTTGAAVVLDEPDWTLRDPEDTAELARMMRLLAQDPLLRSQLGEKNRLKILAHDWISMSSSYLRLYSKLYDGSITSIAGR